MAPPAGRHSDDPNPPRRDGLRWSLRAWLSLSHVLVLAGPLLVLVPTGVLARQLHLQARMALYDQAAMLQIAVNQGGRLQDPRTLQSMLSEIHGRTGTAIHLVDLEGRIRVGAGTPAVDLAHHPQVELALADTPDDHGLNTADDSLWSMGSPIVAAFPLKRITRFPMMQIETPVGAIVLSRPPPVAWLGVTHLGTRLGILGGTMLAISLALALAAATRLARPLGRLAEATDAIAEGRFDVAAQARGERRLRITEIDRLMTAFVEMSTRLQRRLGWIREFASNVSHEFKTPLATLQGTVELLQDSPDMPAEQRERFLDNAAADLERMERMVSGLMELAEAEEVDRRAPVDLDDMLQALARGWDAVQVEGTAGEVHGDAEQLGSVFRNLVHNAVQHGGPDVAVKVFCSRDPRWVVVSVLDDGPGITPGNLPLVFERFFTTARGSGGTGLGLALVRTICDAHGGSITVDSEPGRTEFRVTLPTPRSA